MKRVVIFLLVAVMVFGMVGCGEPKPNDKYSEETVAAMEAAIETLDSFLSYDLDADEAEEKLERIYKSIDTSDTYGKVASTYVHSAKVSVGIYGRQDNSENWQDVKDSRDKLYDKLYDR